MADGRNLMIFTRNPELGKGKRRLARDVGDKAALDIYKFLLNHTRKQTQAVDANRQVWYSEKIPAEDHWPLRSFEKKLQSGSDLGERMMSAFAEAFKEGYHKTIIIGSDLYGLTTRALEDAFTALEKHHAVIGPATDGGYYLLGFNNYLPDAVFNDKDWGTDSVFKSTLADMEHLNVHIMPEQNDVDTYDDIKDDPVFKPFLKHMHAE